MRWCDVVAGPRPTHTDFPQLIGVCEGCPSNEPHIVQVASCGTLVGMMENERGKNAELMGRGGDGKVLM